MAQMDLGNVRGPQGATGAAGASAYVHIKWAANGTPTNAQMLGTPNDYMGVYSGTSATAPTTSSSYQWFRVRGETGVQGTQGATGAAGRGITNVARTSGTGAAGTTDTYTITFSDSTTSTFQVVNGANGATGATGSTGAQGSAGTNGTSAYCHIRYSAISPTQNSDMKTTPDAWMGVYSGTSSTAPTTYTSYTWYNIKGATGPQGAAGITPSFKIDENGHLICTI